MKAELASSYVYSQDRNLWHRSDSVQRFDYSDGDEIEQRIYNIVRNAQDRSVFSAEIRNSVSDWASLYHMSSERANLLRPIMKQIDGPVLEIGAGCGAVTRFLGEAGLEVVALEGSLRRASIAAERCRDLANVSVVVDPFQDFIPTRKFKTVTLIGVLEYARVYFSKEPGRDPVDLMLDHAARYLEPGGVLIVAIENQLGLKYFAGFPEDHLGQPMVGIEDRYQSRGVVTFGKAELSKRIGSAGLGHQEWWYPYPDYKLPVSVLRDDAFAPEVPADFSGLISAACKSDAQTPAITTFSTDFAWSAVTRNRLAGELANSFLIVSSASEIARDGVFGYHYGLPRSREYRTVVEFGKADDGYYGDRKSLFPDVMAPADAGIAVQLGREPLVGGRLWKDELPYITARDGWPLSDLERWAAVWWDLVKEKAGLERNVRLGAKSLISGRLLEAIPRNMIFDGQGSLGFINLGWTAAGDIELGYLLFRGLYDALSGLRFCEKSQAGQMEIRHFLAIAAKAVGLPFSEDDLVRYLAMELAFQAKTSGRPVSADAAAMLGRVIPPRKHAYDLLRNHGAIVQAKDREIARLSALVEAQRMAPLSVAQPVQASNSAKVAYSIAVDGHPKFVFQAYYCAKSLVAFAGVKPSDVHIQFTEKVSDDLISIFAEKGYRIHRLEAFGDRKYCNKISQLDPFVDEDVDYVVLLDADIMVLGDLSELATGTALKAKVVDTPNPPMPVLLEVAAAAQLQTVGPKMMSDTGQGETFRGNCNGGVYVIPKPLLRTVREGWRKWALWLLENPGPLERAGRSENVDQVAMWLTLTAGNIAYEPLASNYNYYGHFQGRHDYTDTSKPIKILHYHEQCVNDQGLLSPRCDINPAVQDAFASANTLIRAEFRNDLFWNLRYKVNPQRGSGVGSRGENLVYKRKLLIDCGVEQLGSVLDIGSGDLEVVKALDIKTYLGLDRSQEAINIAKAAKPEWNFKVFDLKQHADTVAPHDVVICMEVLIHQSDPDVYRSLVEFAASRTAKRLIISGYEVRHGHVDSNYLVFFHEALSQTLKRTGRFTSIERVGDHTDVAVFRCDV